MSAVEGKGERQFILGGLRVKTRLGPDRKGKEPWIGLRCLVLPRAGEV